MRVIAKKGAAPCSNLLRKVSGHSKSLTLDEAKPTFFRSARLAAGWLLLVEEASVPRVVLRVCTHKTPNVSSGGPADLKISHSITADP